MKLFPIRRKINHLLGLFLIPSFAWGQSDNSDILDLTIEELLQLKVAGAVVRNLELNQKTTTGSQLPLSIIERPVSIDVIRSETAQARGLKSVTEAAENLVGVISGESPAEPSSFSMRGFSRDSVIILRDGIKIGPASMTMRPHNMFNLEKLEVLEFALNVVKDHLHSNILEQKYSLFSNVQ